MCGCVGVLGQGVRKATKRPKRMSVSDREQGQGLTHYSLHINSTKQVKQHANKQGRGLPKPRILSH